MRTRTPGLLLVLVALLLGAIGSLVAVVSAEQSADACSIAGPDADVRPSAQLRPGQQIDIAGWGFVEVRMHGPQPAAIAPPDEGVVMPPQLCDFDTFPLHAVRVMWQGPASNGELNETLGVVSGPDFTLTATVPANAVPGRAIIVIGPVTLTVNVGSVIEPPPPPPPPPPCPLTADGARPSQGCPEPWPCPVYATGAATTQPAPEQMPGFWPCPEPCVDYAHQYPGTKYDFRSDCPDPCGYQANSSQAAVWCPPPPDPCPVYVAGDSPADADALIACPDPCGYQANSSQAAVWCPPPPCTDDYDYRDNNCPLPMPAHNEAATGPAATAATADVAPVAEVAPAAPVAPVAPTSTPSEIGSTDAWVEGAGTNAPAGDRDTDGSVEVAPPTARLEVAPTTAETHALPTSTPVDLDAAPAAQPAASDGVAVTAALSPAASDAVASMARHIVAAVHSLVAHLFGRGS